MQQLPWDFLFTAGVSDKMKVKDQNVQTNSLEMKNHNTQTEIVQINDEQMQAESTTQQQGSLIVHITSVACINTWSLFEKQESVTCNTVMIK